MKTPRTSLLITLTGRDRPGVTSRLFGVLARHGLEAEITMGSAPPAPAEGARGGRLHVTLLGSPLAPAAITAIAGRIAASGANIDRIGRLARHPVTCIEMEISGGDPVLLREDLARVAVTQGIDVAVRRGRGGGQGDRGRHARRTGLRRVAARTGGAARRA